MTLKSPTEKKYRVIQWGVGNVGKPQPDWGGHYLYRIVIEGDEPTELILQAPADPQGNYPKPGYTWTAMGPANTVPAVCEAAPGFLAHKELGPVPLRGLVRS